MNNTKFLICLDEGTVAIVAYKEDTYINWTLVSIFVVEAQNDFASLN